MHLITPRLDLVLQTREQVLAMIAALSPAERAEVSLAWLAQIEAIRDPNVWLLGFEVQLLAGRSVVGHCGYKGPPDAQGMVEIAYGIVPECQGQGYATEAAAALVDFALASDQVQIVRAHTTAANNASTRVLVKCHFHCVGQADDPEDGRVWRWERRRAV